MSHPADFEKEVGLKDHVAAAQDPRGDDSTDSDGLEKVATEKETVSEAYNPRDNLHRNITSRTNATSTYSSQYVLEDELEEEKGKRKWYKRLNPLKRSEKPPIPKERGESREHTAGFFSMLTFNWISPMMTTGYQRPLEPTDIWKVNPERSASAMKARMNVAFKRRKEMKSKRPLAMALYDTFRTEFLIGAACQLVSTILSSVSPFVLRYLIQFSQEAYVANIQGVPGPAIGRGIGIVIGIVMMQMTTTMCTNHFIYRGMMVGGEARAVLIIAIFDKAMTISGRAKAGGKPEGLENIGSPPPEIKPGTDEERKWYQKVLRKKGVKDTNAKGPGGQVGVLGDGQGWGNGRIINLMSTDTYRVDQASGMFHLIWASPLQILITLALLIVNITYSALAGFALLVISMPLLGKSVRSLFHRRVAINKITDQRVSLTQEVMTAVRFVKFFGWEMSFLERLSKLRKAEIQGIQILLAIRNAILALGLSMPVFASMLAFITYSLTGNNLSPAPIFSSLALFNGLRLPFNFLPMVIGQVVDALSSLKRIEEFLLAEDAHDDAEWKSDSKDAIVMKDASFTWERNQTPGEDDAPMKSIAKEQKGRKSIQKEKDVIDSDAASAFSEKEPFKILDIDLAVSRKELIAVIGTVGSGKSSLLAALAGDMRRTNGKVIFGASRAFCPQYAWIQNTSVKENIIFERDFDRKWYDEVVDACALRPDFDMLPNGDLTEIGERGITVSGGQKQRLNIARAIYFNADIILMDDPLSAVDAHVGRHIMDEAICGLLKDKCRVLATHQLHVLHRCDRIVWMDKGRIQAVDTFNNLMANNPEFVELMATTAKDEKEEEEESLDDIDVKDEKKAVAKRAKKNKKAAALMQAEERAVSSVAWGVYSAYFKAAGSLLVAPLCILLLILTQGANIATSLWLSWWTSNKFGYSSGVYIGVYASLGASQAILMFIFSVAISVFGTEAAKKMLHQAINRVLRAPMSFFDTTPLGRITNRFSKDIDTMDNTLTESWRMFLMTMAMILSVFILIIAYYYYFAIALGPLFVLFCFSAMFYRASAREIKRHESVLRSHVFSRFSEAVSGTATIRAYGLEGHFTKTTEDALDDMNSAYYLTFANQRWLSVRLDAIGNLLILVTGILVVTSRFNVNPSISGLVLSYIISIVQMIQFTVRQLAEVENNMNATERIHYYGTQLEQEAPLQLGDVPPTWPDKGEITFANVSMRYRPGLPLVLKDLSLHIRGGERIGIVGRTGAGKSSIMSALFRLTELSAGTITIDGIDISTIGLHDLRSRLAIIPQDPTLFRGTIRSNLDPFGKHTDLELWNALRQAHLVPEVASSASIPASPISPTDSSSSDEKKIEKDVNRIHLDTPTQEEGLTFSLGQRQLLALSRALLRGCPITICDEATSSVDQLTDQKIQDSMARGFKGKTVLCIAHRLKTIIGYDRVVVMDQGGIAEVGEPRELWERGGIFRGMCERGGIGREEILRARDGLVGVGGE